MDQTSYYCACKLLLLLQLFSTLTAEHVPGSAHYPTAQPTCDQCNVAEVVTLEPAAPEAVVEQLLPEVDEHAAVPPVAAQQSSSAAPFQGTLLCYTGNLLPLALDIWALVRRLAARGHQVTCLVPDALAKELQAEDHVSVIHYGSVAFQEYQLDKKGAIHELTATLDFQLASCASVLQNRTIMDQLSHGAFNASLGPAADPCPGLLADRLGVQRRAAYDDGAAVPLLWGILMGHGHPTSHVASYGTALGGGRMGLWDKVRNLLQYHRLRLWRARTYEPRLHAFRHRHRLLAYHTAAAAVAAAAAGPAAAAAVAAAGGSRCHLRGTVVVTGADWGLLEPQPLPPAVKLVGPLGVGPPVPLPAALAGHVAGAKHGTAVIAFPPDYCTPLRALLAIAEATIDLKQHIVWQISEADRARVLQVYLPLKHARHVLMLPHVPLADLMAHPNVMSVITDGSPQSLYAALYHGKPAMAVPLSTAQEDLVARLAALGAGQRLSRAELEGGAASYKISVAIERMRNVYSYTSAAQLLGRQLRAAPGAPLDRAAGWVEYSMQLDPHGRHYMVPRSCGAGVGGGLAAGGGAGAGGGGGCMGWIEASNMVPYGLVAAAGVGGVAFAVWAWHVCTRVPPPRGRVARLRVVDKGEKDE